MADNYFRMGKKYRTVKLLLLLCKNATKIFSVVSTSSWCSFYFPFLNFNRNKLVAIEIKLINHQPLFIRRWSLIDRDVLYYVFYHQYHLPVTKLPTHPVILDLGTNIGATICHFSYLYPTATIIGYELDIDNYEIAQKNTISLTQCCVYNCAVWTEKKQLFYNKKNHSDAYQIDDALTNGRAIAATTIEEIIERHGFEKIDYLKMDVEGAEKYILLQADTSWLRYVKELNVEVHDAGVARLYMTAISARGFRCMIDEKHHNQLRAIQVG